MHTYTTNTLYTTYNAQFDIPLTLNNNI